MVDKFTTIEDEWTESAENEPDCDHPFRVTGDVCLNCGAREPNAKREWLDAHFLARLAVMAEDVEDEPEANVEDFYDLEFAEALTDEVEDEQC